MTSISSGNVGTRPTTVFCNKGIAVRAKTQPPLLCWTEGLYHETQGQVQRTSSVAQRRFAWLSIVAHSGPPGRRRIKKTAAKNTMSNAAKQSKSSQHIGNCTKSKYTSYKSRVPPPFEGSSRKAANNSHLSQWSRRTRCASPASTVALSRKSLVVCVGRVQNAYCSRKPQSS